MTVMFVDLVGSTLMAQRHEPEVVRDVTRRYQEIATRVIQNRGGYIAQFAGDGVLAYFGFPAAREDDARRAVLAAIELRDRIRELADEVQRDEGVELGARIGLHTGVVLRSDMGSPDAPDRDAIVGLTPNQAQRVEAATPTGEVAISDATANIVRGYFELESLGRPDMKGIERDVEILRVIGPTRAVDRLQAAGPSLTPLVGRERELAVMSGAWDDLRGARESRCGVRTMLVRGEPGIGKSRIVQTFVRDGLDDGTTVFAGSCAPDRAASPLYPIIQMLEAHFGFDPHDDDEARLRAIERRCRDAGLTTEAVSLLLELLGIAPSVPYGHLQLSSRARRDRMFDAVTAVVVDAARHGPALVAVEDVHWADRTSLDLLTCISEAVPTTGLFVVLTARPAFRSPWKGPCHTTLELGPLSAAEHQALIRALAAMYGVSESLWEAIAQRSDGNPLFTEELAKSVAQADHAHVAADTIPATIRDLLTARLDALGDKKRLAQLAAVIGRDVDVELLRVVSGGSRRQISTGLAALVTAGIMEMNGSGGTTTHRFVHALVRDAAYDSQERLHDRRDAHLRVAHAMADAPSADAGVIAQHFDRADHVDEATQYYLVAATKAQEAAADVEALGYLDRALELTTRMPEGPPRDIGELNIRILRGLSHVSLQGYAAAAAADDYRRGLELSEHAGSDVTLFPATAGIWAYYAVHGDLRAAGEATDRLLAIIHPEIDAEVWSCTGVQRFFEGRFCDAREMLEHAIAVFAARADNEKISPRWLLPNDPLVAALTHLAAVLWIEGETSSSTELFEEANDRATRLSFPIGPFSEAYTTCYAAWLANVTGRFEDARALYGRTVEIGDRHGLAFWTATGSVGLAVSRGHLGEPEAAVAILEPAIEQWRALGAEAFVPCFRTQLAEIRLALGQLDGALRDVDQALEQAARTGEDWFSAESRRVRAAILRQLGRADAPEVLSELETAREVAGHQRALMFELRARLDELDVRAAPDRRRTLDDLAQLMDRCPAGAAGIDIDRARAVLAAGL